MSEHVQKLLDEVCAEISAAEKTIRPNKLFANKLCERLGIALAYPDVGEDATPSGIRAIRRNQFYGRPLSTVIREYLEMRANLTVKEATLDEVFAALKEGGYDVKQSGPTEEDQKRGLSIALGKNSQTFHRLASGDIGLTSWYPNIKERKPRLDKAALGAELAEDAATIGATTIPPGAPGVPETFTTKDMPQ